MNRNYIKLDNDTLSSLAFSLTEKNGKTYISMARGATAGDVAFVSPACVTHWPRVSGDGNFGTMWGPTDISKAKYNLDLTDAQINGQLNEGWETLKTALDKIDDSLLDFVQANQLKILGRKNLSRDECKMLQIRAVKPKYDKQAGHLTGHSFQLNTSKFSWDGMGGKYEKKINICDHTGAVLPSGGVAPGDVVAATVHCASVYCGVGGDKFGISWGFDDVQIVCQRSKLEVKNHVSAFSGNTYQFAQDYQFSDLTVEVPS